MDIFKKISERSAVWSDFCIAGVELLLAVVFAIGLYFVITEYVISPSGKTRRAVSEIGKKKLSFANQLIMPIANVAVKLVRLSPQRRSVLIKKLYSAEIDYTPEFYIARAAATAALVVIFGILTSIITPVMFFVCAVAAFAVYIGAVQEADRIIKEKSERIQGELVLFASTIQMQLATSHDIIKIFESYRKICGEAMRHELDVTLADMKTGSYERALRNFETRVQSQSLSEIIRGLLAVLRGDDQRSYFDMLVHDLVIRERETLKRKANERPSKMKIFSFIILGAIVVIFFYVICYQIVNELQVMF